MTKEKSDTNTVEDDKEVRIRLLGLIAERTESRLIRMEVAVYGLVGAVAAGLIKLFSS